MDALRIHKVVERDGEILVTGLPYKKGQHIEMILLAEVSATPDFTNLTAHQLLKSGLAGLWKNRKDVKDSSTCARQIREQAQRRRD